VLTKFYSNMYLQDYNCDLDFYIRPGDYDLVLLFTPDCKWIHDGQRFNSENYKRWELHRELKEMYYNHGFKNIVTIGGDYTNRLQQCISNLQEI
jgi:nicotinamide riboside kinase